jgi:xanthine dehydrogenase accessory factor
VAADLTGRVLDLLGAREAFCTATVVAGSAPGVSPGAKILVLADGSYEGTLGAPQLDAAVVPRAVEQLRGEEIRLIRLRADGSLDPSRRGARDEALPAGTVEVALEPMLPPPCLIVVGAGHIAVPLVRLAAIVGFETTVIDDRARFASRERFPDAQEVVVDDFQRAIAAQRITPWTYLVLVTRGHEHDEATLQQVVTSPAAYIGMIGSRRRVLLVFQQLEALGVPAHFVDRIYAPVGLDIGARTAEEIALAIMAEIINVRRRGHAPSLTHLLRAQRRAAGGTPAPAGNP